MISAMVIVFREMLEMTLVIGVLLAATRGMQKGRQWIFIGAVAGLIGATLLGLFMEQMESSFDGNGEFIFNAGILLLASIFIAWTVLWMSYRGREISVQLKHLGESIQSGNLPCTALALITFSAVIREGSETVFFLFGTVQDAQTTGWNVALGGVAGAVISLIIGYLIYRGLTLIPLKQLFSFTGWLLILFAAGMISQAAWNLVVIDWLPSLIDPIWNTSSILPSNSIFGELLRVLTGYDEQPSGMQVLAFVLSLLLMAALNYRVNTFNHQK